MPGRPARGGRGISRFNGRSSFRTWLYRVTANRARSTYQVLRRRSAETVAATLPERADPGRIALLDGLEAIGPVLAEPVALGLGYREVAALLGLPEEPSRPGFARDGTGYANASTATPAERGDHA